MTWQCCARIVVCVRVRALLPSCLHACAVNVRAIAGFCMCISASFVAGDGCLREPSVPLLGSQCDIERRENTTVKHVNTHVQHNMAGEDATGVYRAFHTNHGTGGKADKILKYLPHVADLEMPVKTPVHRAFEQLRQEIDRDGLYETRMSFYAWLGLWLGALLVTAVYLTVRATTVLHTVGAAAVFALFLQQCAFVGHDSAHNGITHHRNVDIMIGMVVGPLLTGISTAWWKRSHNAHHVVTNSVSHDPDIQHIPFFAVTADLFKRGGVWSHYHRRFFHFDGAAKLLLSYQHLLYYPVMCFARWNLYVQGWLLLLDFKTKTDYRAFEILCLFTHYGWLSYVVSCLPSWQLRLLWLLVSHMIAGILHVQITISHFSMPTYDGPSLPGVQHGEEFLLQQLHTSMDLNSGPLNDWFYGGLQWQVVHHVFPRVPRHNLPEVKRRLQAMCKAHGLVYKSVGWWAGNAEIYRTLHRAAMVARTQRVVNFKDSLLYAGLHAEG